ncbi:MAG: stage II sporulation protein M [Phenylobacterium sp.]|uniref:stage II sporulation protein M n=1 Tax=Phenylobacterium sp. TaxID=1871053 RepID=UPI0025E01E58|nr:stage II sporulation protein M [Phenylobacterium sp.]MBI1197766.1 stage II sporulation protein M [Phenylobacterium sp.]
MAELQLKSARFRAEREADWRKLDALLTRAESVGVGHMRREELLEIPLLYRQALSSLSVARAISLDQNLIGYLEGLSTRGYFVVYGARGRLRDRLVRFFRSDWPAAVQSLWRETLVSLAVSLAAAVVAYVLVLRDPDWFYAFMDPGMASGRDPMATTASLRETLYDKPESLAQGLSFLAAFLFTHNAQIAIWAFALGFALCLPTAALMVLNGGALGAFIALFVSRGLGFEATGWLMIHGTTELFAIVLSGAAGFSIGWAVIFPGERSRVDAAAAAGRRAAMVMMGVVIMLFVAGLLEGFGRQLIQLDLVRYAIAGSMLALWLAYFYWPRRRGHDG